MAESHSPRSPQEAGFFCALFPAEAEKSIAQLYLYKFIKIYLYLNIYIFYFSNFLSVSFRNYTFFIKFTRW